jgi:hypothetical protein
MRTIVTKEMYQGIAEASTGRLINDITKTVEGWAAVMMSLRDVSLGVCYTHSMLVCRFFSSQAMPFVYPSYPIGQFSLCSHTFQKLAPTIPFLYER